MLRPKPANRACHGTSARRTRPTRVNFRASQGSLNTSGL
jgi:hypothetical protein